MSTELATVEAEIVDTPPEDFHASRCLANKDRFVAAATKLQKLIDTGLLPDRVKTPMQAMVILEMGADVGMGFFESLRSIHVVKGKPAFEAASLGALIKSRFGPDAFHVDECSNKGCTIRVRQLDEAGQVVWKKVEFNEDDAKAAGLFSNAMYKKYPADMYYARAISRVQKRYFQHLAGGDVWITELIDRDTKPGPKTLSDIAPTTLGDI